MEGDAGTGRLNPSDADDTSSTGVTAEDSDDVPVSTTDDPDVIGRGPSRLRRGWLIGTAAALVVLAAAAGAGGYLAFRSHQDSLVAARADAAAVATAKECMAALNAPDAAAMDAAGRKIVDCATGNFAVQAPLLASLLAEAYATVDSRVQVLDLRAAAERHNDDGSIDVLTVLRAYVSSTGKESSYRLRVTMEPVDGEYKVAKIDQVTK